MTLNGEHQRALALLARNPKRHEDVHVVAWLHATTSTERVGRGRPAIPASVVERGEQFKLVGLLLVMIDEELRLVHCDHLSGFFHRLD